MTTEPICSGRQVGMGVATVAAGMLVTSLVAFRVLESYRDWVFVLGSGGSIGAGLFVATKFGGQTRQVPVPVVEAPDLPPPPEVPETPEARQIPEARQTPVLTLLQRAIGGDADALAELDDWLCQEGIGLDELLDGDNWKEVFPLVLENCPAYCKANVGLPELHKQVARVPGWDSMTRDVWKGPVARRVQALKDEGDVVMEAMAPATGYYSWLTFPSCEAYRYLKSDGSSFRAMVRRLKGVSLHTELSTRISMKEYLYCWALCHYPEDLSEFVHRKQNVGYLLEDARTRCIVAEELLEGVKDNRLTKLQRSFAWGDSGVLHSDTLAYAGRLIRKCHAGNYLVLGGVFSRIDALFYGDPPAGYRSGFDYQKELFRLYLGPLDQLDQLIWANAFVDDADVGIRLNELVASEPSRSSVITQMNEIWFGDDREAKNGLARLLGALEHDPKQKLKEEALNARNNSSGTAVSEAGLEQGLVQNSQG